MESITGIPKNIDNLRIEKLGDLLYFEGPLLSHVRIGENEHIMKWVDNDEESNRWMLKKVDEGIFWAYFNNNISLKDIYTLPNPEKILFIDIADDLNIISCIESDVNEIPKSYLPEKDSFFDPEQFEDYSQELSNKINKSNQDKVGSAVYEVYQSEKDKQYYFRLKTSNGRILLTSKPHQQKSKVFSVIKSARRKNIGQPKVEVVRNTGNFLFVVKTKSGNILGEGRGNSANYSKVYRELIDGMTFSLVKDLTV